MTTPQFLTTVQLAARWGLSPTTLRTWRQRKNGPAYFKPSGTQGRALYKISDIEEWENARRTGARPLPLANEGGSQ